MEFSFDFSNFFFLNFKFHFISTFSCSLFINKQFQVCVYCISLPVDHFQACLLLIDFF